MATTDPARPLRLRVSAAAERAVREGHPWVYSDSVRDVNRSGRTGDLGVIFDRRDRFLAIGLFDAESPLRLRVLHTGAPVPLDDAWWRARLRAALDRRTGLFGPETTGYRWIHGESDGWPGLVLDRYGSTLVLKLYTAAWLPRVPELSKWIREALSPERLVLRLSRNSATAAEAAGYRDGQNLGPGDDAERVSFQENGLAFESEVVRGQKTGFFLDQRDNRCRLEALAAGGDVLNVFSFSGGFSLYAARGGARSVTDLDISAHALQQARRNFALNRHVAAVSTARHEQVQGDAFAWLSQQARPRYDLVVLDPPSLARREAERAEAIRAYGRLVRDGLQHLRPGGCLLAASCSAHVSALEFFTEVRSAVRRSGHRFEELITAEHPPDHAATLVEARYLKAIFLRLVPSSGRP